ncbi:MAG: prephenate dehydratase [Candidatus Anammoxibacter sp.]
MSIDDLRNKIDSVDSRITELLNERSVIVEKIGKEKKKHGIAVYDPSREHLVLQKIKEKNKGPLSDELLADIYREIMACSRKLETEEVLKVSFLGPVGTHSYFAVKQQFGSAVEYVPVKGIDDVFKDVDNRRANYGIAPVENSMEGGIRETLNMFVEYDVKVCGEIVFPVHHNLMVKNPDKEIKRIYSKPQAFAQCREWLSRNFKDAELVDTTSTAEAAQVAKEQVDAAAIAHVEVADLYGLQIVNNNIENNPNNVTRFFVLSHDFPSSSGEDKTIAMCYAKNRVGALYDILKPFKDYKINLTNIEPLSTKKKIWDYGFYLDFEGHIDDVNVKKAVDEVAKNCVEIKILGSFPKSVY